MGRLTRRAVGVVVVLIGIPLFSAAAVEAAPLEFRAGPGQELNVQSLPFRFWLGTDRRTESAQDERGEAEEIGTVPASLTTPLLPPTVTGPEPIAPLGGVGGFPAIGFVVGGGVFLTNPLPPFTGNALFGSTAGAIVSVTRVQSVTSLRGGANLSLTTNLPSAGPARMSIRRLRTGGVLLDIQAPAGLSVTSTMLTLSSRSGEALYGLGARRDAFDQRGLLRNVWVEEQYFADQSADPITKLDPTGVAGPAYSAPNGPGEAFFVQAELSGTRGWTAWAEQSDFQQLDLASSRPGDLRWAVASNHLALALAGGGLQRSVQQYTAASGRAPAPPRYVFEPWIDRINQNGEGEAAPNGGGFTGGPATKADLIRALTEIKADRLPVHTFGVEGWQVVPGRAASFPALRKQGFDLVAYWNPFISPASAVYPEALKEGILVKQANGKPFPVISNRVDTDYVIDFTNPKALTFWKAQLARSCALGFEGTHADFGEFVISGMRFYNGASWTVEHNLYPLQYAAATRAAVDACDAHYAKHYGHMWPFFYVRAGFSQAAGMPATSAYTPAVIVGDESTDWSKGGGIASLPQAMLNLAMEGESVFITDIGGYFDLYTPSTTAELFTRWSELAALTPVMRVHDDTEHGSRYPWSYDAATLDAYRRYARLKVRLIPLEMRWTQRAARYGTIGPVRPLVLDDPSPTARTIGDEWLLGLDLLAAPIVTQGAAQRKVYLPAGARWERVTVAENGSLSGTGDVEQGGRFVNAPAPLANMPLYVRLTAAAVLGRCTTWLTRASCVPR